MNMYRRPNVGKNYNLLITNKSFENVSNFKYIGTRVINQSSTHEEIKSRINSENCCCYCVQSILSSRLLCKHLKIKIYKTIILPVDLYGYETWSLTLRDDHNLRV
jgi:hypothetical protein